MRRFLKNVFYSGIQERLTPEEQVKLLFINSMIFMGLAVLLAFGLHDLAEGVAVVGGVTVAIAAVVLVLYFTIRVTKSARVGEWLLPFLMFGFYSYLTARGRAGSTLWMLTYPVIVVFLAGSLRGSLFSAAFLALQACLLFVPGLSAAGALDQELRLRLLGAYAIVFTFSLAFETIRRRAQTELARTAAELQASKVQTDGILTNVGEGIFLLAPDLSIGPQHSQSLAGLLGVQAPAGQRLPDLLEGRLGARDLAATRDYLAMFFLPDPPWHLLPEINPLSEASLAFPDGTESHLTFSFAPVELSTGRRILVTVRDVTRAWELGRRLKEEEDRSARQMRHLFQIIHVRPELLLQFLQDADQELAAVHRRLQGAPDDPDCLLEDLFQGVHAVKGNAALVGLSTFADRVHELEDSIAELRGLRPTWQQVVGLTARLAGIEGELAEIRSLLDRMALFQRGLEASAAEKNLLVLALERAVDRLGGDTGVEVDLDTSRFAADAVPEGHRKLVKDVLVQLVRNSFAHGIEPADERRASGKAPRGRIRVEAAPAGRKLKLAYGDDGRGFDAVKLRQAAGPRSAAVPLPTDHQVLELAFAAGVSTALPGLHAGRGVGLGLVKQRVEAAGGALKWRSIPGKGVTFDITLPIT